MSQSGRNISRTAPPASLIVVLVAAVLSGCAQFQPEPAAVAREPEAADAVRAEPQRPEEPVQPGRADATAVLAGLPEREIAFMLEFQQHVEAGNWAWVVERAEKAHYNELVNRTGMDQESYLTFLLRMGESYNRRIRRDDAEPGYFSPYDTVEVVYTDYRKESITTVVEGLFYNQAQRSIDFAVTLLGELVEIRLTGAYY